MNERRELQCPHKEINNEGFCKSCGVRAAVEIKGLSEHLARQRRKIMDLRTDGSGKGEAAEAIEIEEAACEIIDLIKDLIDEREPYEEVKAIIAKIARAAFEAGRAKWEQADGQ